MPTTRFEFGDIVLVRSPSPTRPHPSSGRLSWSATPPTTAVLMAATSQLRATAAFGEVWIGQWEAAGLLNPSAIKPVFTTIEQRLVIRRLGTLAAADQAALRQAIGEVIG